MQSKSEKLPTLILLIYAVLMLVSYSAYLFLEKTRLNQSQQWRSEGTISQEDVNSISQMGRWTTISETTFLLIFLIAIIFVMYRYQKKPLIHFFIVNAALFIGVALVSYVLSLIGFMPIGNLIQPVIIPSLLLIAALLYSLWKNNRSS